MQSFSAVIDAFGIAEIASLLKIDESHARTMKARNSIPPEYWGPLIEEGARRNIHLTYQMLREMRANRFESPSTSPQEGEGASELDRQAS